jgi:membrane protein implicated in regulation of membrane protease activity
MAESKYWFARRFPVGHPRNAMSPVTPEGFRVVYTFLAWMIGGVIAAGVVAALGVWIPYAWALAPIVFVGCAAYGGWYFISQAQNRGDHQHTVEDYKAGRV